MMLAIFGAHAEGSERYMSPLKAAFQQAREQRNIDLVLPVFKAATLYVIVGSDPSATEKPEYFLTKAPKEGRLCVTVSESEAALASVRWPKRKLTGDKLLKELPPEIEIVIAYPDGGDYLNREQLAWYREQL